MPEQGRLGDKAQNPSDGHGCPSCAHPVIGPAVGGSPDVYVNNKHALRVGDPGVHAGCCGPNTWNAQTGSSGVYINGIPAHRKGDTTKHCGGTGKLIDGSGDVFVGNGAGGSAKFTSASKNSTPVSPQALTLQSGQLPPIKSKTLDAIQKGISFVASAFDPDLAVFAGNLIGKLFDFGVGKLGDFLTKWTHKFGKLGKLLKWGIKKLLAKVLEPLKKLLVVMVKMLVKRLLASGAAKNDSCPSPRPVTAPAKPLVFTTDGDELWKEVEADHDVCHLVHDLLDAYKPVFVEHKDDVRAVSMEEMLAHGKLVPAPQKQPSTLAEYAEIVKSYPKDGSAKLDIQGDWGREGNRPDGQATYYGRAIKKNDNEMHLQYCAIRPQSYFAWSSMDESMWEHEGDGENCEVIVRRRGTESPWLIAGVQYKGLHTKADCALHEAPFNTQTETPPGLTPSIETETTPEGRPVVYVAIGSHALSGESGPRKFSFHGVPLVDYYPSQGEGAKTVADYVLKTSADPEVYDAVFTTKVTWGKDTAAGIYQDVPGFKEIKGYPGYDAKPKAQTFVPEGQSLFTYVAAS